MKNAWLSATEIDSLRSVIGQDIIDICAPTVRVLESSIAVGPSASIRLKDENWFLIVDACELTTDFEGLDLSVEYRPRVRKSSIPDKIPYTQGKEMVIGPCSVIALQSFFRVTSIVVFQHDTTVNIIDGEKCNPVPVSGDIQVTFYSGESRPISTWTCSSTTYFSLGLGLAINSSLKPRLVLK
jgi:hypothetical protein